MLSSTRGSAHTPITMSASLHLIPQNQMNVPALHAPAKSPIGFSAWQHCFSSPATTSQSDDGNLYLSPCPLVRVPNEPMSEFCVVCLVASTPMDSESDKDHPHQSGPKAWTRQWPGRSPGEGWVSFGRPGGGESQGIVTLYSHSRRGRDYQVPTWTDMLNKHSVDKVTREEES